ncbi:MAG: site-specific integrase [Chlorobium sp.]|nr:site-specific integrase [Chlorobium sp.]
MALKRQAKVLTTKQVSLVLNYLESGTRHSVRNKAIFLLSVRAGLRAKEIAALRWSMLMNADGELSGEIHLTDSASKGRRGGRVIYMNKELQAAIKELHESIQDLNHDHSVIRTERSPSTSPQVIVNFFQLLYRDLNLVGCSSHSGRRTFITSAARKVSTVGGSLRDVQELAGHASLQTTQRYIDASEDAKRKLVEIL